MDQLHFHGRRRVVACCLIAASLATAACTTRRATLLTEERMFTHIRHTAAANPRLAADAGFARAVAAERSLHRRDFVPPSSRGLANIDVPVDIGAGQTISDPYIVAVMTAAAGVRPGSTVLEIGTGSGYQAAVLHRLGARVATIEIVPELAARAAATFRRLGLRSIAVRSGDGFVGWPERAPFDAIIVTAGVRAVPPALLRQLAPGGTLVIPIGATTQQERIMVLRSTATGIERCSLGPASFVPLTGAGAAVGAADDDTATAPLCYGGPVT